MVRREGRVGCWEGVRGNAEAGRGGYSEQADCRHGDHKPWGAMVLQTGAAE